MSLLEEKVKDGIIAAVKDAGSVLVFNSQRWYASVDGTAISLNVREGHTGDIWHSRPSEKVTVQVGTRRFPHRKAGHDYAAIARAVLEERDIVRAKDDLQSRVAALNKKCSAMIAGMPDTQVAVNVLAGVPQIKLTIRFESVVEFEKCINKLKEGN